MKKILFLLVLIYNYSNAYIYSSSEFVQALSNLTCTMESGSGFSSSSNSSLCESNYSRTMYSDSTNGFTRGSDSYSWFTSADGYRTCRVKTVYTNYVNCVNKPLPESPSGACQGKSILNISGEIYTCNSNDGSLNLVLNPDPIGGGQCRDLFQKDGQAYTCNPNTNEASIIPNSNGTIFDENGEDKPNCNSGYDSYSVPTMTSAGGTQSEQSYNVWGCSAVTSSGDTGTGSTGSGTTDSSSGTSDSSSGTGTGSSGSGTSSGGTSGGTDSGSSGSSTDSGSSSGSGTSDSTSGTGTGSSGSGTSSGGSGTGSGTSGTGSGDTGTGSTDTTGNPDTNGTDDTGTGNCGDANLTLQEKMLCQLKQGNDLTNSKLGSINTNLTNLNSKFDTANTNLTNINSNIEDSNNILGDIKTSTKTITDFIGTIKELITNPSQIGDKLSNQLSEVAGKFQTDIISNSSCGVCPTISIPYHGSTVTFLSQSLIDNYFPIAIMKTMIILSFAFAGFMNFFRGNN